jgi:hypothetical protein
MFVTYLHFHIVVTMQAQDKAPSDMQRKDTFVIQSVFARPGKVMKDITPEMVTSNNKLFLDIV